jgi:hypothetical protein
MHLFPVGQMPMRSCKSLDRQASRDMLCWYRHIILTSAFASLFSLPLSLLTPHITFYLTFNLSVLIFHQSTLVTLILKHTKFNFVHVSEWIIKFLLLCHFLMGL